MLKFVIITHSILSIHRANILLYYAAPFVKHTKKSFFFRIYFAFSICRLLHTMHRIKSVEYGKSKHLRRWHNKLKGFTTNKEEKKKREKSKSLYHFDWISTKNKSIKQSNFPFPISLQCSSQWMPYIHTFNYDFSFAFFYVPIIFFHWTPNQRQFTRYQSQGEKENLIGIFFLLLLLVWCVNE